MTDITELAQREKFEAWAEEVGALPWGMLKKHRNQDGSYPGPHYTYMWKAWQAASAELVEVLEKAQTINAAAEKLVRCKGRYHSEQNYRALAALFGVTTPDLPPLEHENVHYADAAEMEIAALRQRIAELEESHAQVIQSRDHYKRMSEEGLKKLAESRTVKLPEPFKLAKSSSGLTYYYADEVDAALTAAGIKVEAE
ncbi:TPA: ead/Ea22-like family protein [Klebsiella pneumoniae]|nr:ead/Ea22-like family protein [Klebsiella pneumoniae]HBW3511912.1 ead/Ea22-like family protein [Klebsiella pneumoniae]HBY6754298.1 ead/Ea22-like family protein [Klebsiella pneumoniae]HBY7230903.1 ead/Ea22-like family protein [Klebsiella pneumoniae]HDK8414132.1 ead/Ea22-like family protein [Klebsiella pneumoniae]